MDISSRRVDYSNNGVDDCDAPSVCHAASLNPRHGHVTDCHDLHNGIRCDYAAVKPQSPAGN